jgi:hypothetical protein
MGKKDLVMLPGLDSSEVAAIMAEAQRLADQSAAQADQSNADSSAQHQQAMESYQQAMARHLDFLEQNPTVRVADYPAPEEPQAPDMIAGQSAQDCLNALVRDAFDAMLSRLKRDGQAARLQRFQALPPDTQEQLLSGTEVSAT